FRSRCWHASGARAGRERLVKAKPGETSVLEVAEPSANGKVHVASACSGLIRARRDFRRGALDPHGGAGGGNRDSRARQTRSSRLEDGGTGVIGAEFDGGCFRSGFAVHG